MADVFLGLGTNMGDLETNLRRAIKEIEKRVGPIVSQSSFIVTEPWGYDSDNMFLNAVVEVSTQLEPLPLLDATQAIEKDMGRKAKSVNEEYTDRIIDIDILLYDNLTINSRRLTVPHKYLSQRMFVLQPLSEICPETIIPGTNKTVEEMKRLLEAE